MLSLPWEHSTSIAQTREVPAVQTVDLRREFRTRGIGIGAGKTIVALDRVSLAISQGEIFALSTGMRQRINLCRALVSDPEILFLDEPTVGLDVEAARVVRNYVRSWMQQNPRRTVLLTTHYMFEADELCHRVAVINRPGA